MTIRRTTLTAAATLLALSTMAACNDGDAQSAPTAAGAPATASPTASATPTVTATEPTPTASATPTPTPTPTPTASATATGAPVDATGAFDPAVALANADRTPYAATETMKTTATAGGQVGSVLTGTGRVNYNTPTREGRTETKMTLGDSDSDEPTLWMETINTGTTIFMRDRTKPGSAWRAEDPSDKARADDTTAYVKALVEAGPAARKGMEQKNGVPAFHLGARLTAAQIKAVDPKEYQKMVDKGAEGGKQIDVWIDRAGRILAQTQSMKMTTGGTAVTSTITLTYTDFGPRETFTAPTAVAG
ncbi:hypothetical protein [Kitasatospora purpeofusca]|uniref:hypothetical protein n=1 Tax=Kitasatospora purpeofusca TaxID=67352 RepID=UPI002A59C43F|nr:hypothetical protein [Kitasatospora purpeofusca]MDY0813036.1 hypothetical protein [Kitasatospora purpeofusca]